MRLCCPQNLIISYVSCRYLDGSIQSGQHNDYFPSIFLLGIGRLQNLDNFFRGINLQVMVMKNIEELSDDKCNLLL